MIIRAIHYLTRVCPGRKRVEEGKLSSDRQVANFAHALLKARGRIDSIFDFPTALDGGEPEGAIGAGDDTLGVAVRIGQSKHAEFPVSCDAPDRPAGLGGAKVLVRHGGKPDIPIRTGGNASRGKVRRWDGEKTH